MRNYFCNRRISYFLFFATGTNRFSWDGFQAASSEVQFAHLLEVRSDERRVKPHACATRPRRERAINPVASFSQVTGLTKRHPELLLSSYTNIQFAQWETFQNAPKLPFLIPRDQTNSLFLLNKSPHHVPDSHSGNKGKDIVRVLFTAQKVQLVWNCCQLQARLPPKAKCIERMN